MILIDLLQKHVALTKVIGYEREFELSSKENQEMRELITLLTLNNIWTVEDLKKTLNK